MTHIDKFPLKLLAKRIEPTSFLFQCYSLFLFSNYKNQNVRQMSNEKVSQQLFISVKEKLDYYRLPTTFPIQATHVLNKLLNLIEQSNPRPFSKLQQGSGEGLSAALRFEMSRILKQSNQLHLDLMTSRQENQSLLHRLYKIEANKNSQSKEMEKVSHLKSQRQQELIEELREVKYKYNELMDFVHEDPKAERQYIKRLMKHRHQEVGKEQEEEHALHHLSQQGGFENSSNQRIKELEIKVKNREAEILRLQNLVEFDGMNMNKIIKNFQQSLTKNKLKDLDHKINFLEESYNQVSKQNENMKNKNGSKEALRIEVEKCHKIIEDLKKENKQLKRNQKEQGFDIDKKTAENQRKVSKLTSEKAQAEKKIQKKEELNHQLQKKIGFLQKQSRKLLNSLNDTNKRLQDKQEALLDHSKKHQELKVFYEYQIDTYKKKLHELQFEAHELRLQNKKILHENEILRKQGDIKNESIINLQKIVNELLRKNSLLSDNAVVNMEQALRKGDEESKRHQMDLEQQLIHAQIRLTEMQEVQRALLIQNENLRNIARRI